MRRGLGLGLVVDALTGWVGCWPGDAGLQPLPPAVVATTVAAAREAPAERHVAVASPARLETVAAP